MLPERGTKPSTFLQPPRIKRRAWASVGGKAARQSRRRGPFVPCLPATPFVPESNKRLFPLPSSAAPFSAGPAATMGPALSCAAPFSALGTLTSRPGRPAPRARRCDCPAAGHQPRPRRAPAAGRRRSGRQILHLVYWLTRRAGAGSNRYRVDRGVAAPPEPAVGFLQAKLLR